MLDKNNPKIITVSRNYPKGLTAMKEQCPLCGGTIDPLAEGEITAFVKITQPNIKREDTRSWVRVTGCAECLEEAHNGLCITIDGVLARVPDQSMGENE